MSTHCVGSLLIAMRLGFAMAFAFVASGQQAPPAKTQQKVQENSGSEGAPAQSSGSGQERSEPSGQPIVSMLEPGVFRVGTVLLNKKERTITFPASLNASAGAMEYLLVTTRGKVHESILKTDAEPYHIHTAMLLLGGGAARAPQQEIEPGPVKNPSKEALPGNRIDLTIRWEAGGRLVERPASELIYREDTHSSYKESRWIYNGSVMSGGKFLAQLEGSIVSLITDPAALINNTGPGHDNDQIWGANTNKLPAPGIPVQIIIRLPAQ